jgi:regulator of replication initiation timing
MRHQVPPLVIDARWTPTAENIDALPPPLRRYIHHLQSNVDSLGTMRENFQLRQEVKALRKRLAALEHQPSLVPDAFFFDP